MAAWLSGWSYRRKITIDQTKVDADLTDFPVAVLLTAANFTFAHARADGFDVRFTSGDGETLLKHERVSHDQGGQTAEYHAKIPAVSSAADTDYYLYYGKADASDGADPTNTWDGGFVLSSRMKDDPDTSHVADSTANNNDGTKVGANEPIEAAGKMGKGQDFDGSNDYINCGNAASLQLTNNFTVEAWVKADNLTSNYGLKGIAAKQQDSSPYYGWQFFTAASKLKMTFNFVETVGTSTLLTDTWYHVAMVRNAGIARMYLNGVDEGVTSTAACTESNKNLVIARRYSDYAEGFGWDGIHDEIRVSNVPRSAAWLLADYHSGNGTLASYGAEEEEEAPTAETSITAIIDGASRSRVARLDIWRESLAGVGRFEVGLDNAGNVYGGAFIPHDAVELKINGVSMMKGWVDDVLPNVKDPAAVYRNLIRVLGRDYGRQLVDFFHTRKYVGASGQFMIPDAIAETGAELDTGFLEESWPAISAYEFNRQYLFNGFQDIAKLTGADFYVTDETGADFHGQLYGFLVANAPGSGVTLKAVAAAGDNNILSLEEVGENVGFDIKNYVEVKAGDVDDHWTEGNAGGFTLGILGSMTDDTDIYLSGRGSIRATFAFEDPDPLTTYLVGYLQFPKYGYPLLDFSNVNSTDCSAYFRHDVNVELICYIYIRDDSGNTMVYPSWGSGLSIYPPNVWKKPTFPLGWDAEGWSYISGANFTWRITQLGFAVRKGVSESLVGKHVWFDGLKLPGTPAIAVAEDSGAGSSQDRYGKRMIPINRTDIKSQVGLDAVAADELAKRKDPTQKLKVTATFQKDCKYAGQTVDVLAPDSGIYEGTYENPTPIKYRIISLHHAAAPKADLLRGHDAITEFELVKHTAAGIDPLRMRITANPTWTAIQRTIGNVRSLERG